MSEDSTQSYKANFIGTMKNIFGLSAIDKKFMSEKEKNSFTEKIEGFCKSKDILYADAQ